jgi:hypothetical protein
MTNNGVEIAIGLLLVALAMTSPGRQFYWLCSLAVLALVLLFLDGRDSLPPED